MIKTKLKTLILLILILFPTLIIAQNAEVIINQPKAIEQLLEFKKDLKTVNVFKIQVYDNVNPDKARAAKSEFQNKFSEWPVSIEFQTPNYKIWVGNFIDRLEADRALLKIKKNYMYAFIFQPKKD